MKITVLPKSALGKALGYLDHQWPRLTRFLNDGLIPLDNNPAENAIRPFVLERKSWLFSHTPSGAQVSAAIYSLIETAKANGLSPYEYLQHNFATLPTLNDDDLDTLLPWQRQETLPIQAMTPWMGLVDCLRKNHRKNIIISIQITYD